MLWEGRTPSKNMSVRQRGAGDILSLLQLMAKVLQSSKGSGFHFCVHPVGTGPDSKGC